jgi:ABC-type antimicrobial peptide transport system permease subunit
MRALVRHAVARLRVRWGRALLAAGGIAAASAMLGAAVTVAFSLHDGFQRAADRADLPDVIARFDQRDLSTVRERVGALPNVAGVSYRYEERRVHLWSHGIPEISSGQLEGVQPGRRGYAVVAGRDLRDGSGEAVIEQGLAKEWHLQPGDTISFRTSTPPVSAQQLRIVGVAVSPDNVAYPLASAPRVWVPYRLVASYFAPDARQPVNQALVWVHDPDRLDVTLEQARTASFGIGGLVFATRDAVRIQIDQAAGIVIALLVAFSLVALAGAVVMLAASSRVEVERRIESFALLRALGASPRAIVAATAAEAMLVALPAAVLGLLVGTLAARGPADRLLEALDQFPAGWSLLGPLAICLCVVVGVVAAAACWPVWRACRRPVASMLRGGVSGSTPRGRGLPAGAVGLGMRMVVSRPVRTLATAAVLAASCAVILLMLALATTLDSLESDPGVLGKRYQLTARGSASTLDAVSAVPGVGAAAQRFSADVADSYQLGESFQLIAYCGDRLRFEAPQLAAGRRATRPGEAEVGQGLASAIGLQPGTPLVTQFANGGEARFRVVGIVRAFDNDGRIAYVQPGARICDAGGGTTVVQLTDGASRSDVAAALARAGFPTATVGGVTTRNAQFLGVLAALLRTIAIIDGLVCLYAVVQMLALTAYERRSSIALIRACGADTAQVAAVFAGAALVVAAIAAPVAIVVQRTLLGPQAADLAATYATISLAAAPRDIAAVLAGLLVVGVAASAWVGRQAVRDPIVRVLRDE